VVRNIEGERSTRYFCNLEKRHYTEKIIPKLILEDNTEVTHQKDILVQQNLFYQTLYESRGSIFTNEHLIGNPTWLPGPIMCSD
jgi:hypothetical protein